MGDIRVTAGITPSPYLVRNVDISLHELDGTGVVRLHTVRHGRIQACGTSTRVGQHDSQVIALEAKKKVAVRVSVYRIRMTDDVQTAPRLLSTSLTSDMELSEHQKQPTIQQQGAPGPPSTWLLKIYRASMTMEPR